MNRQKVIIRLLLIGSILIGFGYILLQREKNKQEYLSESSWSVPEKGSIEQELDAWQAYLNNRNIKQDKFIVDLQLLYDIAVKNGDSEQTINELKKFIKDEQEILETRQRE